jgi:CheY-like chemotaxis protein
LRRVLIVDDNNNNLLTLELLLENFKDLKILTALNGVEAIKICKNEEIDLIFMDIMMPVMDGIEATKEIRSFNKKVMIIAVTALDDEDSKNIMLRYGAEDYIVKPIDGIIFKKRVEHYLELIEYRNQRHFDNQATNLFNKNVYNRSLIFRIFDNSSLSEFWEYYLTDAKKEVEDLNYCMRVVYVLGQFLLKSGKFFEVISEENDEMLYITQTNIDAINEKVIKNIILKHYSDLIFSVQDGKLSFAFHKIKNIKTQAIKHSLNEEEENILRATHDKGVSAKEFLSKTPVSVIDKLEELEDTEDKVNEAIFEFEKIPSKDGLNLINQNLVVYNSVIDELIEFQNLSIGINSLIKFLNGIEETQLKEINIRLFTNLLLSVLEDLSNWRKSIFVEQSARDIHYLDSSLLNSCLQIESVLSKVEEEDNDLELF